MESIYFVITWLCHRKCPHCYEDRFQPYYGEDLRRVVEESAANVPRIIANLPERMTFRDLADAGDTGEFLEKRGRIILAGGEVLLDPIREPVLYPAIRAIRAPGPGWRRNHHPDHRGYRAAPHGARASGGGRGRDHSLRHG